MNQERPISAPERPHLFTEGKSQESALFLGSKGTGNVAYRVGRISWHARSCDRVFGGEGGDHRTGTLLPSPRMTFLEC